MKILNEWMGKLHAETVSGLLALEVYDSAYMWSLSLFGFRGKVFQNARDVVACA